MRKFKIIKPILFTVAVLGLGLSFTHSVIAAEYYVDGTNGNDVNYDGTAPTFQGGLKGPKKTIKEGLKLLQTSDDLKIRQGLYFESGLNLNSGVSGSLNDRITVSNYNNESVFLSGGHLISDSSDTSRWTQVNDRVYRDYVGSPNYHYLFWTPNSGNGLDDLKNIRLGYQRAGIANLNEEGEWVTEYVLNAGNSHYFYTAPEKDMADYTAIGFRVCESDVFSFSDEHDYVTFDGLWFIASTGVINTNNQSDFITINNSYFYGIFRESHCGTHGIELRGNNNLIENSEGRIMSSYFISGGGKNFTIKNNKFSYGRGNVIHIFGEGMKIQNNDFSHYATSWYYTNDDTYKHAEGVIGHTPGGVGFSDLLIEGNRFHDEDAAKGNPFGVDEAKWDAEVTEKWIGGQNYRGNDIGNGLFYSALGKPNQGNGFIYRHNLHEGKTTGVYITCEKLECSYKNVEIYGNIFVNIGDERTCEGCNEYFGISGAWIGLNGGGPSAVSTYENLKIYNNLFYNYRWGLSLGSRANWGKTIFAGNSFIKNNIFRVQDDWSNPSEAAAVYFDDSSQISGISSDYNLFYRANSDKIFAYNGGGVTKNLSGWQQTFNRDASSNFAAPNLFDPSAQKFWLAGDSPAIDAGINLGLVKDYAGAPIPVDGNGDGSALSDVGPYEYQGGSNPADINSDGHVNIKDIQICIKAIVDPDSFTTPDQLNQLTKCKSVAPPEAIVNIKDIQKIVQVIVGGQEITLPL